MLLILHSLFRKENKTVWLKEGLLSKKGTSRIKERKRGNPHCVLAKKPRSPCGIIASYSAISLGGKS